MEHLSKNKIKWIRSLKRKKIRDAEGVFIVEGTKMVEEILAQWQDSIQLICTTDDTRLLTTNHYVVSQQIMKELSVLSTPSTMLAVVKQPKPTTDSITFILALDGIQDPGNMGTIIRTADWFGVDKIVCSKETVDIFNPKVIQSSMGSLFRIPVEYVDLSTYLETTKLPVYGTLLQGNNMYDMSLTSACVVLMGNEGKGVSDHLLPFITNPLLIPGTGGAESLNVSVATGIVLAQIANS